MRSAVRKQIVFKKEHTDREIYQYIIESEAPDLYLAVKLWYKAAKLAWILLNILATAVAVISLVWLSYPQYVETSSDSSLATANFLNIMEILCVLFFTFDYCLRWHASDLPTFWTFAKQPMNIVDAVTTLPFYFQVFLASVGGKSGDLFRFVYCIRMMRVVRLGRYHTGMRATLESLRSSALLLAFLVVMMLMTLAMTSTAFFYAERTTYDQGAEKWLRRCPNVPRRFDALGHVIPDGRINCTAQIAPAQSIPDAMYWSIVTVTTVGMTSETPTSGLGKTVAAITSIIGIFFFVAPATILSANYKKYLQTIRERKLVILTQDRLTRSMMAQEKLRREMERVYQLLFRKDQSIPLDPVLQRAIETVKMEPVRQLIPACTFNFLGQTRTIYQVEDRVEYVYPPLVYLKREGDHPVAAMYELDPEQIRAKIQSGAGNTFAAFADPAAASSPGGDGDAGAALGSPVGSQLSGLGSVGVMSDVSQRGVLGKPPLGLPLAKASASSASVAQNITAYLRHEAEERLKTKVVYTDDFNRLTGERLLTCYLVLDSEEAQAAARRALESAKLLPPGTTPEACQVHADRECGIRIAHDTAHCYPGMGSVVYLDDLAEHQGHCSQAELPVRFIVAMPHLHGVEDAMQLLRFSRLHVTTSVRHFTYTMHIHVPIESIFASKFAREITTVGLARATDHHTIAYVHQADAALLLEGFCTQFVPTPSPDAIIVAPHVVDQQVFNAIKAACPHVRLDCVPLAAANSCYRSSHLTAEAKGDSALLMVDLTRLQTLDDLGHDHRFRVHVPLAEESLTETYFTMA
jgi:hypothetical protein